MLLPTLALLTTSLAALSSATVFHNNFGHDGWLQDNQGTEVYVKDKNHATIGGGWGFFWIDEKVCHQNAATFEWPSYYGDVYLKNDGRLYDAGGGQISGVKLC
ncbi:hypothetical protein BJX63DRAFT_436545 [Aspergillus granulosus]|uniref:Uncharacterized protein n=1 Tax=Aspergillus granulosus TaxID=176169 RepID=A0ABR4GXP6_9EURO